MILAASDHDPGGRSRKDKIPPSPKILNDTLPLILAAVLGRLRTLPFPETSEELRFRFLELLSALVKKKDVGAYSHDMFDGRRGDTALVSSRYTYNISLLVVGQFSICSSFLGAVLGTRPPCCWGTRPSSVLFT